MRLKKKYVIGAHAAFYECLMFEDYISGILNCIGDVENKENIFVDLCINMSEHFEKIDPKINKDDIEFEFKKNIDRLYAAGMSTSNVVVDWKHNDSEVYNIAQYRHNLNEKYCTLTDYICWGEVDSFFPAQTFEIIEQISENTTVIKYVVSFSYRKMWGEDWKIMEHPKFTDEVFQDNEEWTLHNEASEKSEMSIQRMNEINNETEEPYIIILEKPKFDGSCTVFSSDLIKSGVNIPKALLLCAEDTGMSYICEKLLGKNYVQYHVKNILRVHNRRRKSKRIYVLGEDNEMGFCDKKGLWWDIISKMSKENLYNLDNPKFKSWTFEDYFNKLKIDQNEIVHH